MCEQETHSVSDDVTLKQRTMRCGRAMKNIFIYEKVISLNERMARAGTKSHIWHNYSDIFELCFGIFLSFSLLSSLLFSLSFLLSISFALSQSLFFTLTLSFSIALHRSPSLSISLHPESNFYFSKMFIHGNFIGML